MNDQECSISSNILSSVLREINKKENSKYLNNISDILFKDIRLKIYHIICIVSVGMFLILMLSLSNTYYIIKLLKQLKLEQINL